MMMMTLMNRLLLCAAIACMGHVASGQVNPLDWDDWNYSVPTTYSPTPYDPDSKAILITLSRPSTASELSLLIVSYLSTLGIFGASVHVTLLSTLVAEARFFDIDAANRAELVVNMDDLTKSASGIQSIVLVGSEQAVQTTSSPTTYSPTTEQGQAPYDPDSKAILGTVVTITLSRPSTASELSLLIVSYLYTLGHPNASVHVTLLSTLVAEARFFGVNAAYQAELVVNMNDATKSASGIESIVLVGSEEDGSLSTTHPTEWMILAVTGIVLVVLAMGLCIVGGVFFVIRGRQASPDPVHGNMEKEEERVCGHPYPPAEAECIRQGSMPQGTTVEMEAWPTATVHVPDGSAVNPASV